MVRKTPISFDSRKYATARREGTTKCTIKHKNRASYNTDYIVLGLIGFFSDDWIEKGWENKLKKETFNFSKNILLTNYLTKYLTAGWIKQSFWTKATSVSFFWDEMFPNQLKPLL